MIRKLYFHKVVKKNSNRVETECISLTKMQVNGLNPLCKRVCFRKGISETFCMGRLTYSRRVQGHGSKARCLRVLCVETKVGVAAL